MRERSSCANNGVLAAGDTSGVPEKHGFGEFLGYDDRVHAHTVYPQYRIRNSEGVRLQGNRGATYYDGDPHAQLEIFKEARKFIRRSKDEPFFCYLPWMPPHGLWGIDEDDPSWQLFKDKPWTAGQRTDRDARGPDIATQATRESLLQDQRIMKPTQLHLIATVHLITTLLLIAPCRADDWIIDTADDWARNIRAHEGATMADGAISPAAKTATVTTKVHSSERQRSARSLVVTQSAIWQNWIPSENLGPSNLADAPVLLTVGPDNYWMFGRYGGRRRPRKGQKPQPRFEPQSATLAGFEIPLQTTPFPNQFNAPGGLKNGKGGYHAWQSRDMKNWVHHGPVTEGFSKWVTSAEWVDGKAYIYYDFPNDQDPHVYVDDDLFDGEPGKNMGLAVADPSHGSDAGFIRDLDGNMHVIIEDWSPISADKRSWDSPLAGHALSPNGLNGFIFKKPPVDNRTKPTGKIATYKHPHWAKEDPKRFPSNIAEYEVHEPEQEAYGDWAPICIGGQYYLFGDYDPTGGHQMAVGWFTSSSIDDEFTWCDHIGKGHPDPDIAFAEGQFYLATQMKTDYVSPGPWVETVEARVGVDTGNDGKIDQWTDWAEIKERYEYIKGFSKQIARTPAELNLSTLPAGYGFRIELRLTDSTENKSKPIIQRMALSFAE